MHGAGGGAPKGNRERLGRVRAIHAVGTFAGEIGVIPLDHVAELGDRGVRRDLLLLETQETDPRNRAFDNEDLVTRIKRAQRVTAPSFLAASTTGDVALDTFLPFMHTLGYMPNKAARVHEL